MRIEFAGLLRWLRRCFGRFRRCDVNPSYLVRLCRRRTEFTSIINEATNEAPPWADDLVGRVVKFVFEGDVPPFSVYATKTIDPLDQGHALAVIAESIAQKEFHASARQRKKGCTRGTLVIPSSSLPEDASLRFTPENNLNFFPADDRHYDLYADVRELAKTILNGIHSKMIHWTFLGNDNRNYRLQAAIAYSCCLSRFGKLDHTIPPLKWRDGNILSRAEQIEILMYLADTSAIDSPLEDS